MLFVSCLCVALLECSACNMSFHVECSPIHSKSHYICPFKSTNQVDGVRFQCEIELQYVMGMVSEAVHSQHVNYTVRLTVP